MSKRKKDLLSGYLFFLIILVIVLSIILYFNLIINKESPKEYEVETIKCYGTISKYCDLSLVDENGDIIVVSRNSITGRFKDKIMPYENSLTKLSSKTQFNDIALYISGFLGYLIIILAITCLINNNDRMKLFIGLELMLNIPCIALAWYFEGFNISIILYPILLFIGRYVVVKLVLRGMLNEKKKFIK